MSTERKLDIGGNALYGLTIAVGAFVVLALANINSLTTLLNGSNRAPTSFFIDVGGNVLHRITMFLDKLPFGETTVTFLFWLLVGIVVYGLVLVGFDMIYTLRHERSLLFDYRYPVYAKKSSIISRMFFLWILVFGFALVLGFMIMLLIFFTFPVTRAVFMDGFYNTGSKQAWFYTFEAVILLAANGQIITWLTKIFLRSRHELAG